MNLEVIDAFVDGERVDPSALKDALASVEGRDYLVAAWTLREGMQDGMASEVVPAMTAVRRKATVPWLVAASIAFVSLVAGYAIGGRLGPVREAPAASTNTLTTAPATKPSTSFPMPAPTRVIPLDMRTSSDASGGN